MAGPEGEHDGQHPGAERVQTPLAGAGGLLWVGGAEGVQALDPHTMASRFTVQTSAPVQGLAAAGGLVWAVAGTGLTGIDPTTGSIARTVALAAGLRPRAWLTVAASPDGAALWTAEANGGEGGPVLAQARDPHTGAALADGQYPMPVVVLSSLTASTDQAWASFASGNAGNSLDITRTAGRLSLSAAPTHVNFTNAVTVTLADGALWTTDASGKTLDCIDPTTGTPRATSIVTDLTGRNVTAVGATEIAIGAGQQILLATPTPTCSGQG